MAQKVQQIPHRPWILNINNTKSESLTFPKPSSKRGDFTAYVSRVKSVLKRRDFIVERNLSDRTPDSQEIDILEVTHWELLTNPAYIAPAKVMQKGSQYLQL